MIFGKGGTGERAERVFLFVFVFTNDDLFTKCRDQKNREGRAARVEIIKKEKLYIYNKIFSFFLFL